MTQNALASLFPRGGWDFQPADASNFINPLIAGMKDYRQNLQQEVENERQNKLMQLQQDRFGLEKGRYGMDQQRFTREEGERAQMFPLDLKAKNAQIAQTQAQTGQMLGANAQAERMARLQHELQVRLLSAKSEVERQQLNERARALGLVTDQPSQSVGPVNGYINNDPARPMGSEPQATPAPSPQTIAPQSAIPSDPYQGLVNPAIPRAQSEAERRQKAAQALALGDEKGAVKILNKDDDPKEYQTKDAIWAERMGRAEIMMRGNIGTPDNPIYNPGRKANAWWPDSGFVANMTNSEAFRNYQAGAREWIAALLRKDTGAAVTNTEWELYFPTYFPQPGDSAEVQRQKLERRVAEARKLRASSGGFFERMAPNFDAEMGQRMREQDARRGGRPAPQGAVRVTSPDEARRLPSGTPIILPDGTQGRVP
jgi:hypothetical protein